MENTFTRHGMSRLQQRSIPHDILALIQDFGSSTRSRGADRYFMDKSGRTELQRAYRFSPLLKRFERYLNVYVVVSDSGQLITAGRRTKRFKRNLNKNFNR